MTFDPFAHSGPAEDPHSNLVAQGIRNGKVLLADAAHNGLITKFLFTCIAVVAIDKQSNNIGLWHLYPQEEEDNEGLIRNEILSKLERSFDREQTELYLIGGKNNGSHRLAKMLLDLLPRAGFEIVDTALFSAHTFDVAVTCAHEIYIRNYDTHALLMHKPASSRCIEECQPPGTLKMTIKHMPRPALKPEVAAIS